MLVCLLPSAAWAVETVRIAMGEQQGQVVLCGKALTYGQDAEDVAFTPLDASCATVRRDGRRLLLDGEPVAGDSVRLRAEGIRVGHLEVRGDVVVRLRGERLLLINVIPLEDYLAAVLGAEMPITFPEEALKAQAVAARTYALKKKLEAYSADYHLGSSVLHQVYGGLQHEDARTHAAVEATRGEVLTFDLEPIEAYFHASCGGRTESGLSALGRDLPYLQPVECPCGSLPTSRWTVTLPLSEVGAAAGDKAASAFEVVARSRTGRARTIRVGPNRTVDAVALRQRLGYTRLKSLSFEAAQDAGSNEVHLTGRGYGHGAGLCQWGAKVLSDRGWSYRQILEHYYPGAELQQLY